MNKETKIELLKILAMVIILVTLIIGIILMNKSDTESLNNNSFQEQTRNRRNE